jgi:hypothetical protein
MHTGCPMKIYIYCVKNASAMNSKQIFMLVAIIAALSVVMIAPPVMAQMADNASMGNLTIGNMTGGNTTSGNMTGSISSLPPP